MARLSCAVTCARARRLDAVARFLNGVRRRPLFLPLALIFFATLVLVSPVADFPLNDDWVYGKSVQMSLDQGRIVIHPFSMTFAPLHIAWGAAWTAIFGFSYTVLRASTLVWALAGAYAVAWGLRALGVTWRVALFAGALTLLNPLYLNLSYTFMTDVPFAAWSAVAGFFCLRALRSERTADILAAAACCVGVALVRQFGVLIAAAYVAVLALAWLRKRRKPAVTHVAAFLLPWVPAAAYAYAYARRDGDSSLILPDEQAATGFLRQASVFFEDAALWCGSTGAVLLPLLVALAYAAVARRRGRGWIRIALTFAAMVGYVFGVIALGLSPLLMQGIETLGAWVWEALRFTYLSLVALMYVGLFLAPLGLVRLWAMATRRERWGKARWRTFLAFVVAAQTLCCGVAKHHLPLLRNMLTDLGVGPRTLVEPYHLHPFWAPVSIGGGWWVITEIALLTAGILFCDGIALCRRSWREIQTPEKEFASRQGLFLLLWAAMMTAALLGPWISALYDRYLVQALVPWCLVFAYTTAKRPSPGRAAWGLGIAGLLIVAAFGVACLQDYLAWNRARWDAVQLLHERFHATPAQVDGGYEYNGLYTSDGYQDRMRDKGGMEDSRAGWYLIDNQYTISFLPREGYREIARAPYFSWLGMERRELLVEERTDPDTAHN